MTTQEKIAAILTSLVPSTVIAVDNHLLISRQNLIDPIAIYAGIFILMAIVCFWTFENALELIKRERGPAQLLSLLAVVLVIITTPIAGYYLLAIPGFKEFIATYYALAITCGLYFSTMTNQLANVIEGKTTE